MYKKSDIISVKKVLILTADLSPKWWVGTSDRTGQNSLKLEHSLLKSGQDRKKIKSEIMQCIKTIFFKGGQRWDMSQNYSLNCITVIFLKKLKTINVHNYV